MFQTLQSLLKNGYQTIDDVRGAKLPENFRGYPIILEDNNSELAKQCMDVCPTDAISLNPLTINLGKCIFCGECEAVAPKLIHFTNDHLLATNTEEGLLVRNGKPKTGIDADALRKEIHAFFGGSLKLRQISAAGDNSAELELNASGNINFDLIRYGIDFVASPRHADGILITGPISENMSYAIINAFNAVANPKVIILCGTPAISGGLFSGSNAINRNFLKDKHIDLYIPGNPPHPLTIVAGIAEFIHLKNNKTK